MTEGTVLDETSLAIGRLQAQGEATARELSELKYKTNSIDTKLDKLLARSENKRFSLKHWAILLGGSSAGAGGIAHLIRKIFE